MLLFHKLNMKNESYIKEKELYGYSKTINESSIKTCLNQINNCVCKIQCNEGGCGTGFFCKIQDNWNILRVLITNNHVLGENDIMPGRKIYFSLNKKIKEFEITIDEYRKIYTNENLDVTIIEIKEKDGLNNESFLEIDENIQKENINNFKNISIYLLHFPKGEEAGMSEGVIKNISENNNIQHLCSSNTGSSGGPLIKQSNHKVIGVHKGAASMGKNYNLGTFLKQPIEEFLFLVKNQKDLKINNNSTNINENNNELKQIKEVNKNQVINYDIENSQIKEPNKNEIINNNKIIEKEQNVSSDEVIIKIKTKYEVEVIKFLGEEFVKNNKNHCKIIINEKEYELFNKIKNKDLKLTDGFFEFKLRGINKINNMKRMFSDCRNISKLIFSSDLDIKNVTNLSNMFSNCKSLTELPDISKWDTSNVIDMSGIFSECESLIQLPDISKWNMNKVKDMSTMFLKCIKLKELPDISNWKINNVININSIFSGCKNLTKLPDISNWKTDNLTSMSLMFSDCISLKIIPNISNWNTDNVTDFSGLFNNCRNLTSLPKISKWETNKVTTMNCMFFGCAKLSNLPDISKWDTSNVTNMYCMFAGCKSLTKLPDLSKWNTEKVTDLNGIFQDCNENLNIPYNLQEGYSIFNFGSEVINNFNYFGNNILNNVSNLFNFK